MASHDGNLDPRNTYAVAGNKTNATRNLPAMRLGARTELTNTKKQTRCCYCQHCVAIHLAALCHFSIAANSLTPLPTAVAAAAAGIHATTTTTTRPASACRSPQPPPPPPMPLLLLLLRAAARSPEAGLWGTINMHTSPLIGNQKSENWQRKMKK